MPKWDFLKSKEDKFKVTVGICAHRDIKLSVFKTLWDLKKCPNPDIRIMPVDGDALISRSRSRLASYFLEKTNDDALMFLDDDVGISTLDATKLMWLSHKEIYPIIGAIYVTKSKQKPGLAARPLNVGEEMKFGISGGIYEMRNISTGCMIIRREVLQAMTQHEDIHYCKHTDNYKYYSFFKQTDMLIDGEWQDISEDWFFCEVARSMGIKIYADTTIKLEHTGPYQFTWDDIVNKRPEHQDVVLKAVEPNSASLNGSEAVATANS